VIEAAGLSFIFGMKIPDIPYVVGQWQREHPGQDVPDGHILNLALAHRANRQAA
jgi:hypothetical protein